MVGVHPWVALVRTTTPRRGMRQGNQTELHASPPHVCGRRKRLSKTQTTLGNGYLGSRIDEERSEMRYLV